MVFKKYYQTSAVLQLYFQPVFPPVGGHSFSTKLSNQIFEVNNPLAPSPLEGDSKG